MSCVRIFAVLLTTALFASPSALRADEAKVDVQDTIRKGLEWLARNQVKRGDEGFWEANGNQYPTTMTGIAGMCFLMEEAPSRKASTATTSVKP